MGLRFLISVLNNVENPKRDNRQKASIIVNENPELFEHLVNLTFKTDDKISICWLLVVNSY